jgi:hypothetical protein
MTNHISKPASIYILLILLIFQGISGLAGGIGLVMDPTGESLQIPLSWIENSPFENYLIPGLILLTVLGIFPLVVSYALWRQLIWAWTGGLFVGIALIVWIGVEILIIGYQSQPPLQLIYGSAGLLLLVFLFLPSTKKFFKNLRQKQVNREN